ncbi:MAG: hypothetical protein EOO40_09445 [Deltaproteobacteria bacterium]|nr:MAG: hypothetical protein EOO40_09445 [Deltaproteobacteria bacterium]
MADSVTAATWYLIPGLGADEVILEDAGQLVPCLDGGHHFSLGGKRSPSSAVTGPGGLEDFRDLRVAVGFAAADSFFCAGIGPRAKTAETQ